MFYVRLRGLPFFCRKVDIADKFLGGVRICRIKLDANSPNPSRAIYFVTDDNHRFNGKAYVIVETEIDLEKALSRDRKNLNGRYIEVFRSNEQEWKADMKDESKWFEPVVRLVGLPFNCSSEDIRTFFYRLNIPKDGIVKHNNLVDQAFVRFESMLDAREALQLYNEHIVSSESPNRPRSVEIYPSSEKELERPNTRSGHILRARGTSVNTTVEQMIAFFKPLRTKVTPLYDRNGKFFGAFSCEFDSSEQLQQAMTYDRKYVGQRYVELSIACDSNPPAPAMANNQQRNQQGNKSTANYKLVHSREFSTLAPVAASFASVMSPRRSVSLFVAPGAVAPSPRPSAAWSSLTRPPVATSSALSANLTLTIRRGLALLTRLIK